MVKKSLFLRVCALLLAQVFFVLCLGAGQINEFVSVKKNAENCLSPNLNIADKHLTQTMAKYYQQFVPFSHQNVKSFLRVILHDLDNSIFAVIGGIDLHCKKNSVKNAAKLSEKCAQVITIFNFLHEIISKDGDADQNILDALRELKEVFTDLSEYAEESNLPQELKDKIILLNQQVQSYLQVSAGDIVVLNQNFSAQQLLDKCLPDFKTGLQNRQYYARSNDKVIIGLKQKYQKQLEKLSKGNISEYEFEQASKDDPALRQLAVKLRLNTTHFFNVQINSVLFASVMQNLMKNCQQHMQVKGKIGEIKIEFMQQGNTAEIIFSNPGAIAPEFLEKDQLTGVQKLFLPGITTKQDKDKHGYGLFSAVGIMRALGGDIFVENKDGRVFFYLRINSVRQMILQKLGRLNAREGAQDEYLSDFKQWLNKLPSQKAAMLLSYNDRQLDALQQIIELRAAYYFYFGELLQNKEQNFGDKQDQEQTDVLKLREYNQQIEDVLFKQTHGIRSLVKKIFEETKKSDVLAEEVKIRQWKLLPPANFMQWLIWLTDHQCVDGLENLLKLTNDDLEKTAGLYDFILPVCRFVFNLQMDNKFNLILNEEQTLLLRSLMQNYRRVRGIEQLEGNQEFILNILFPMFSEAHKAGVGINDFNPMIVANAFRMLNKYIKTSNIFKIAFLASSANQDQYERTKFSILNTAKSAKDPEVCAQAAKIILEIDALSDTEIVEAAELEILGLLNQRYRQYGVDTEEKLVDFFQITKARGSKQHLADYWTRQLIVEVVSVMNGWLEIRETRGLRKFYLLFKAMQIIEQEHKLEFTKIMEKVSADNLCRNFIIEMQNGLFMIKAKIRNLLQEFEKEKLDAEAIEQMQRTIAELNELYLGIKKKKSEISKNLMRIPNVENMRNAFLDGIKFEFLADLLLDVLNSKEIDAEQLQEAVMALKMRIAEIELDLKYLNAIVNQGMFMLPDFKYQSRGHLQQLVRQIFIEQSI